MAERVPARGACRCSAWAERFEVGLFCHVGDVCGSLSGFHTVVMTVNGAQKYGGCWREPQGPCHPTCVNATLPEPVISNPHPPPHLPHHRKPGPPLTRLGSVRPPSLQLLTPTLSFAVLSPQQDPRPSGSFLCVRPILAQRRPGSRRGAESLAAQEPLPQAEPVSLLPVPSGPASPVLPGNPHL